MKVDKYKNDNLYNNEEIKSDNNFKHEEISKVKALLLVAVSIFVIVFASSIVDKYFKIEDNKNIFNSENIKAEDFVDLESYDAMKDGNNDSDKDGAPNWKESVLGTDPNNYNDFSSTTLYNVDLSSKEEKPNYLSNFTALAGRDLYTFSSYESQDSSNNLSSSALNDQLMKSLSDIFIIPYPTSTNSIKNPTADDYKNYYNEMGKIFAYMVSSGGKELEEYMNAISQKDQSFTYTKDFMKNLDIGCSYYAKIKVPTDLADLHKKVIYECGRYVLVLYGLSEYINDPIKSQIAYSISKENYDNMQNLLKTYSQKVKDKGYNIEDLKYGKIYYLAN